MNKNLIIAIIVVIIIGIVLFMFSSLDTNEILDVNFHNPATDSVKNKNLTNYSFYDPAIEGKKNYNWTNYNNNLKIDTLPEYTILTPTVDLNQNRYIIPPTNIPPEPFVIEFKKHGPVNEGVLIIIGSCAIDLHSSWENNIRDANHIKFTVNNGTISLEHDGIIENTTISYSSLNEIQFRFNNVASGNLKYSDFMIYSLK